MNKRVDPLSKIKLVYRPGSTLLKAALLGVIVLSTAALIAIHGAIARAEAQEDALRAQAAALEQSNDDLQHSIDELGSQQSVIDIAEKELGLVDPDTVVFVPDN